MCSGGFLRVGMCSDWFLPWSGRPGRRLCLCSLSVGHYLGCGGRTTAGAWRNPCCVAPGDGGSGDGFDLRGDHRLEMWSEKSDEI